MRYLVVLFMSLALLKAEAQTFNSGVITGTVLDDKNKALNGATAQLFQSRDSLSPLKSILTDENGLFQINDIPFGYYRLKISYIGFHSVTIDSIYFRAERYGFNLNDIVLKSNSNTEKMDEVIIYAEKPLIQSKDGNITFNAGESPLSAGSSASELLTNVPLVTKDPTGKILVRGREPKILIDDKPVDLNLQQLQDLLESMPGSSIEKIEVLTNPPPQYANEQGGVINIVTKKGSVGISGRLSLYGGTRGEAGTNGSFNYRKQNLSININAGTSFNDFEGYGNSIRQNIYPDSINYFNTNNNYFNKSFRPNLRANINYDLSLFQSFNLVLLYNQNDFDNRSATYYKNINHDFGMYRVSNRHIKSFGDNYNPNISFSYTLKTKKPGESLKLISNLNYSTSITNRDFDQQSLDTNYTPYGNDSLQQQITDNRTKGYNIRLNYDLPLFSNKTFLSLGSYYNYTVSNIIADASYKRTSDREWIAIDALTNNFRFRQDITNLRGSVKQVFGQNFSTTLGINAEQTRIQFDLYKTGSDTSNSYWSFLPFISFNKNWHETVNLSFSYRRTIRRPGINELNPTIDFSDPYSIRFGNPGLIASQAHNFDLVLGRNKNSFYANLAFGYNIVQDIFSQVRTLLADNKTQITWQNISGRKEYEVSTWSGYSLSRKVKANISASYIYNTYNTFDKQVRNYRDGASFTSNLNANYTIKDLYTATGSFTFNRFANPQGTVRGTLSMNIGLQAKMLNKKLILTVNIIDPLVQQQYNTVTYGTNFILNNYSLTQSRNYRLTVGYNFYKSTKKKAKSNNAQILKNALSGN